MKKMRRLNLKNSTFLYRKNNNKTLVVILPCYYIQDLNEVKKRFKIKNKYDVIHICFNRNFNFHDLIKEIEKVILKMSSLYNKTIIIGYSKGGIVLNYLNLYSDKITYICGSTPHKGVWYTPKEEFYNRVKNPIIRKIYSKIIDNDFADEMIGENNPIIKKMKINKNITRNYVIFLSKKEIVKAIKKRDIETIALAIVDKLIGIKGDGMIPKESQEINENIYVEGSHANGFQKIMKDLEKKGHL